MNVEPIITEELATVARSVLTPPPPAVADLVRQAEKQQAHGRRNLAVVAGLAAAAVLGAVLLGNQLGKPDASPSPAPQPTQTATAVPVGGALQTWIDDHGHLHLDGVTVPGRDDWAGAVTSGDLTTVQLGPYDTGDTGVFLGSHRIDTIPLVAMHDIPVSPDHRTIAWIAFDDDAHTQGAIVVGRVADDGVHTLGRLAIGSSVIDRQEPARDHLFSVADDGTVLYGSADEAHSWKPGGTPEPADATAYGTGPDGFPASPAQDLRLNPTRTWGAWSTEVSHPADDESEALFTAVTFQRTGEPDSRATISFAGMYAYVNIVGWESDTDLIVYAEQKKLGPSRYLRCDLVARSCEYAPEPSAS